MESGKKESVEGTDLPNQECIKTLGEKYRYLGILEPDTIQTSGNEGKK